MTLAFVLAVVIIVGYMWVALRIYQDEDFDRPILPKRLLSKEVEYDRYGSKVLLIGYYFTPLMTAFIRCLISVSIGILVSSLVFIIFWSFGLEILSTYRSANLLITVLITLIVAHPNQENLVVPPDHVAFLTWLGNRWEWYLTEGEHPWIPKFLGFDVSTTPIIGAKNQEGYDVGEEQGFIFTGERVINVWNGVQPGNRNVEIQNETRLGSRLTCTFQIAFLTIRPLLWARVTDPIMQIANQARSSLRESVSYLVDKDNVRMPGALRSICTGHGVVTAVTEKTFDGHPAGTVVKNFAGNPIYEIAQLKDSSTRPGKEENTPDQQAALDTATKTLQERIASEMHPEFEKGFNNPAKIKTTTKRLHNDVSKTIRSSGGFLTLAIIGDVHLSDTVSEAAQAYAAVGDQRRTTVGRAEAQKEGRKILALEEGETDDQMARVGAMIQSGTEQAEIIYVTGNGGDMANAAAIHRKKRNRNTNNDRSEQSDSDGSKNEEGGDQ